MEEGSPGGPSQSTLGHRKKRVQKPSGLKCLQERKAIPVEMDVVEENGGQVHGKMTRVAGGKQKSPEDKR